MATAPPTAMEMAIISTMSSVWFLRPDELPKILPGNPKPDVHPSLFAALLLRDAGGNTAEIVSGWLGAIAMRAGGAAGLSSGAALAGAKVASGNGLTDELRGVVC